MRAVRPLIFEERTGTEEVGLQVPLRPLERPQPPAPMHVPPSFGANVFLMYMGMPCLMTGVLHTAHGDGAATKMSSIRPSPNPLITIALTSRVLQSIYV